MNYIGGVHEKHQIREKPYEASRTVLQSSEEGRPSSLRQQYANKTSEEDLKKIIGSDEIIGRAYNELNQYSWTSEERAIYEQDKKREDDNFSCIMQSRIEGKIEVAKNLLKAGVSIELIAESTDLAIDEIEKLK
ncbi:hypothetical protein wVul_0334 [Wolbachia endosymbiont of Armadillidium vulgare str. wVulC]|nr:hypothetical protein wVul_0334 [Wolbachia endosymbiont of Armadillidium vulgare str. wVulC]OJH30913.1 PD-(D/E)XK nuclease family transposase [Wolbachia endosymbiont of Armadillidium vulgare]